MGGEWPARIGHARAENGRGGDRESLSDEGRDSRREQDTDSKIRSIPGLHTGDSGEGFSWEKRTTGKDSTVEEEWVGKGVCSCSAGIELLFHPVH